MRFQTAGLLVLLALPLQAGGHGERHCDPKQGPAGATGAQGVMGYPGKDGQDADYRPNHANVGADVLWHEWDNHIGMKSGYRFDTLHHGHTFDMAVIQWRVGKSAEDRRIDDLERQIADYKAIALMEKHPVLRVKGRSK